MTTLHQLISCCDELLQPDTLKDYCPNGLQVARRDDNAPIKTLVCGVTASEALIHQAAALKADVLLVHHGYFWRGEAPQLTGMKFRRIRALMDANMALLAYHLPLDVHAEHGNNACLGRELGIRQPRSSAVGGIDNLFWQGEFDEPISAEGLAERLSARLGRVPLVLGPKRDIRAIGWCSGGAQQYVEQAAMLGLDAYISGEVSEQTTHFALENDITYFAAGHHATERFGVQSLGKHLATVFGLDYHYVEIENPV